MRFDRELVLEGVRETRFRGAVRHLATTGSTSTLAMEAAAAGERDGVWVADEQTAGRGRGGHAWHSAAGDGLYCSALVRPGIRMTEATVLPLAVGLAVRAAVEQVTGLLADLRWPNDLLLGGVGLDGRRVGARKFGGILVEAAANAGQIADQNAGQDPGQDAGRMRFAVIGVGLNVGHREFPEELREMATSLRREGAPDVGREEVLVALLRGLERELQGLEAEGGVRSVIRRFSATSSWVQGKRVQVGEGTSGFAGVTRGLTNEGFLRVMGDDGAERTVLSGGVREPGVQAR